MKRVVSSVLQELHEVMARVRCGGIAGSTIDFLDDVNNAILELSRTDFAWQRGKMQCRRASAIILAATYSQNQVVTGLVQSSKFAPKKISRSRYAHYKYLIKKRIFFYSQSVISALPSGTTRFLDFEAASPQSYPQPCGFLLNSYMKRALSSFPQELH